MGAFALPRDSRDTALYRSALPPGSYTVQIVGNGAATGEALAEIYDATATSAFTPTTPRLTNVSARTAMAGGDTLFISLVIGGNRTRHVLIRAVGPGLAQIGGAGVKADPRVTLFAGTTVIGTNDNWGAAPPLGTTFASVGALALPGTSRDAALKAALEPGAYSAQVTGVGAAVGITLVEVYELP